MTDLQHVLTTELLQFGYRKGELVLQEVCLSATAGRFVAVLGPNGSGKTTLLRCLLGRLKPGGGRILLDGRPLARYSHKALARLMGYVPQFPELAFAFTVRELVLMGRFAYTGALGLARQEDVNVATAAMEMTDTLQFSARTLGELSGGEAQCVMIARALAQQPQVMLLDEPTSHLDIHNQLKIYRMMQRLAHDWQMAVVCVSHDVNLASRFADELVLMRDGRVVASGTPVDVISEQTLREVYEVEIELIDAPGRDVPLVVAE